MPLYSNAEAIIREHLDLVVRGIKPRRITIAELTREQLTALNAERVSHGFKEINGLVFFRGSHIYVSRILRDGYTVEDVIDQIRSAFSEHATVHFSPKMSSLRNPVARPDRYGNKVNDECALECFANHPKSELFSVIPKGDRNKPPKMDQSNESHPEVALVERS